MSSRPPLPSGMTSAFTESCAAASSPCRVSGASPAKRKPSSPSKEAPKILTTTSSVSAWESRRSSGKGASCAPTCTTSRRTEVGSRPPSRSCRSPREIVASPSFARKTALSLLMLSSGPVASASTSTSTSRVSAASRASGEPLRSSPASCTSPRSSGLSSTAAQDAGFLALRSVTGSSSSSSSPSSSSSWSSWFFENFVWRAGLAATGVSSSEGLSTTSADLLFVVEYVRHPSGVLSLVFATWAWDKHFPCKGVKVALFFVTLVSCGSIITDFFFPLSGVNRFSLSNTNSFSPSPSLSSSMQHLLAPKVRLSCPTFPLSFFALLNTFEMTLERFSVKSPSSSAIVSGPPLSTTPCLCLGHRP